MKTGSDSAEDGAEDDNGSKADGYDADDGETSDYGHIRTSNHASHNYLHHRNGAACSVAYLRPYVQLQRLLSHAAR